MSAYLGNGIVIFGDSNGHIFRSTDYGTTWSDLGLQFTYTPYTLSYLENGILTIGSSDGHIFRSTDYGITWDDLGNITNGVWNQSSSYLGNGIVVFGDGAGHIFRSNDYGITWVDLGIAASLPYPEVRSMSYAGNGIVIFGDGVGHIHRSIDYGVTWADLGMITANSLNSSSYLGNGVVMISDTKGHIFRSVDTPSSICPTTTKNVGDTLTLNATPIQGVAPYTVEFRRANSENMVDIIDTTNIDGETYIIPIERFGGLSNPVYDVTEGTMVTRLYTINITDINDATSKTPGDGASLLFATKMIDSCTPSQSCVKYCKIFVACSVPVCDFTVI